MIDLMFWEVALWNRIDKRANYRNAVWRWLHNHKWRSHVSKSHCNVPKTSIREAWCNLSALCGRMCYFFPLYCCSFTLLMLQQSLISAADVLTFLCRTENTPTHAQTHSWMGIFPLKQKIQCRFLNRGQVHPVYTLLTKSGFRTMRSEANHSCLKW